ncbi:MAG: tetratricopeptide repeat protein [Acidobacteria bacterium]|nr:tetratricopeptide repeat protein [Acidobacteriota bacterium]
MTSHTSTRAVAALALTLVATLAFAQAIGHVRGRVVDEQGQPVADAAIVMEFVGDVQITVNFTTNDKGEFVRSGLRTGTWRLQATKGELVGRDNAVRVNIAAMTALAPVVIKAPVAGAIDASGMTDEEIEARNTLLESLKADFAAGDALMATDPDAAIAKYMGVAEKAPQCAVCYARIGDANIAKKDEAAAEAAYLKAIEFDPKMLDVYSALAGLYNQQKKFKDAAAMNAKVNELQGSTGGGSAEAVLNQGIIHWNAGEYPQAKAQFERATQLDPKLSEAFFHLGMASLNLGQLPDAVKAFETYLSLAPAGEHAETAKSILKSIKGTI